MRLRRSGAAAPRASRRARARARYGSRGWCTRGSKWGSTWSDLRERAEARSPSRPRPSGLGGCLGAVAVLLDDPGLQALDRLELAVNRAEVVEVLPIVAGAEGARREGHVDLAV